LKIIVAIAVFFGLIIGITFAVVQTNSTNDGSLSAEASGTKELDPKNLPPEVLKSLPPEELAELFPEKSEAILNPESAKQIATGGKISNDPKYLRAVLEKLGADPPADATTKELQDMLAHISESTDIQGK
jgi:hypothetical protein